MDGSAEDTGAPESWEMANLEVSMARLMVSTEKNPPIPAHALGLSALGSVEDSPAASASAAAPSASAPSAEDVLNQVDEFLKEALPNPRERLSRKEIWKSDSIFYLCMDELQDWASSDDDFAADFNVDLEDWNDEGRQPYNSGSIPRYQFRKDVSKGRWNEKEGMAEIVEKKGGMWVTTGIIRKGNLYCWIEEILFLAERGALLLLNDDGIVLPLREIYAKVSDGKYGCCWESFEAYRHLKSLGYILGRHGIPWTVRGNDRCYRSSSQDISCNELEVTAEKNISIICGLKDIHINDLKPNFDVYLPNSKFRKSAPGDPDFMLCLLRGNCNPPLEAELQDIMRECKGIPLKFCHTDLGRVNFFSFDRVIPVLP